MLGFGSGSDGGARRVEGTNRDSAVGFDFTSLSGTSSLPLHTSINSSLLNTTQWLLSHSVNQSRKSARGDSPMCLPGLTDRKST